jgi:dihydroxyacetone kinase
MTSLEMAGVSVTVLHVDDVLLQCLDYPTDVPGWSHLSEPASYQPGQCLVKGRSPQAQPIHTLTNETDRESTTSNNELGSVVQKLLRVVSDAVIKAEDYLNELDSGSGDGDCGSTFKRGAQAVIEALSSGAIPCSYPSQCLSTLANIIETSMGGTSGALYSIMLTAAAVHVNTEVTLDGLVEAFGIVT